MDERDRGLGEEGFGEQADLNEVLNEAEQRFREGIHALKIWGTRAREAIEKQPAAVLAGVAILGFVTGLLMRRMTGEEERK